MTHASVFSGIGGPEVAASMLGWRNLFHCELNAFGRRVLQYWYPDSKSYEDITKTDFREWRGQVNVLTGGFPCQPFSVAGKRKGADDDRYLWPHMHRCINEVQPDWFIGENVVGILTMVEQGHVSEVAGEATLFGEEDSIHRYEHRGTFTLERICRDVEADGYEVTPILIPACAVGAPHRRDRVFIVGHRIAADSSDAGIEGMRRAWKDAVHGLADASHTDSNRGCEVVEHMEPELADGDVALGNGWQWYAADTESERTRELRYKSQEKGPRMRDVLFGNGCRLRCTPDELGSRWRDFPTVSPIHRGNDGLPFDVDDLTIPFPKWRNESIKAYGNAILPQVMYEIFRAISEVERMNKQQV